jgi:hypothetical protein
VEISEGESLRQQSWMEDWEWSWLQGAALLVSCYVSCLYHAIDNTVTANAQTGKKKLCYRGCITKAQCLPHTPLLPAGPSLLLLLPSPPLSPLSSTLPPTAAIRPCPRHPSAAITAASAAAIAASSSSSAKGYMPSGMHVSSSTLCSCAVSLESLSQAPHKSPAPFIPTQ